VAAVWCPLALIHSDQERYLAIMQITPDQIRAARALLRLEQRELAQRAKISIVTVRRLEAKHGGERVAPSTLAGVRAALEQAGAEFIPGGIRRRRVDQADARARFATLRAISLRSAARLQNRELLTDADLYDENGLPA